MISSEFLSANHELEAEEMNSRFLNKSSPSLAQDSKLKIKLNGVMFEIFSAIFFRGQQSEERKKLSKHWLIALLASHKKFEFGVILAVFYHHKSTQCI